MVFQYTDGPTLIREPFHRAGWVDEEKVDGWRIIAYKDGDGVRLLSRHGVDHTKRFAGIAAAIAKLSARTLVLGVPPEPDAIGIQHRVGTRAGMTTIKLDDPGAALAELRRLLDLDPLG